MLKEFETLSLELEKVASAVSAGWTDDRPLNEQWGWNFPNLTRHELAAVASNLANDLKSSDVEKIDEPSLTRIKDMPRRLAWMQSNVIPHFYNGNGNQAVPVYLSTLNTLRKVLLPKQSWESLDPKSMPSQLARRIRSLQAEIAHIIPDAELLKRQVENIQEAHRAAESLPIDLEDLAQATQRVHKLASEAGTSADIAKTLAETVSKHLDDIAVADDKASKLVSQCEEAYRITTSKGLAGAFDQRAVSLAKSMWIWVFFLLISLGSGAYLGLDRLKLLSDLVQAPNPHWGTLLMHIVLSVFSVGAPVWFAWISTKQIGNRFKLSEDYAFKASVAKAYEGYRREAANLDKSFESRLFESALTRLEEAPLRFVEQDSHGSPVHELLHSKHLQAVINTVPELRDKLFDIAKQAAAIYQSRKTVLDNVEDKSS